MWLCSGTARQTQNSPAIQFLYNLIPWRDKNETLIPTISTIISQQSKEKYGLVVAKQAAFTAHLVTGTSWEFSQNLLLDHV